MQLALMCGGLTLATWGCGFLSLVFKGEDQQTLQETEVCDDLSSGLAAEVPLVVELRTDQAGTTRYRDLSLGGTEVDLQWVPIPNQHADAAGWVQAGNFTKMDFQPPLQRALMPDSVIYIVYAPADARDAAEQGQLNALNSAFGPSLGAFIGRAACIVTPLCTSCRAISPHGSEPGLSKNAVVDRRETKLRRAMSATQIYFNPWDPASMRIRTRTTHRCRLAGAVWFRGTLRPSESARWKLGSAKSLRGCSTRFSARASLIRHADAHQSPPGVTKNDQQCCHALTAVGAAR